MSTGFGETLADNQSPPGRAFLSPPAAASWLANGRPLDAGTAMMIQSNEFWLQHESVRPLAYVLGDGGFVHQGADGWDGLSDGTRPNAGDAATTGNVLGAISWSQAQCIKTGPHFVPQDAPDLVNPGQFLARAIRFDVQVSNGGGTLSLLFALTATNSTPDLGAVAFLVPGGLATGHIVKTLQPLAPLPGVLTPWTCRPGTLEASIQSQPCALWAWVGYKGSAPDAIIDVSIYEVRP